MPFERESFVSQRVRRYSAFQFLHDPCKTNLANFQDIEMGPTAFERETNLANFHILVPFRYLENWLSLFYRDRAKIETHCISESFEVQTKVREVQTGTNDSLSNAVGLISISLKMIDLPSWNLWNLWNFEIAVSPIKLSARFTSV